MLSVLREAGWNPESKRPLCVQSLRDFPAHVCHDVLGKCEDTRGIWMVRAIFRGIIDGEQSQPVRRPQFLAIAHAMLARLELLVRNCDVSYSHAREALRVIDEAISSLGGYSHKSEIERAELGSLHLCVAESSAQRFLTSGNKEHRKIALKEYEQAIEEYSSIGAGTEIIRDRMNAL